MDLSTHHICKSYLEWLYWFFSFFYLHFPILGCIVKKKKLSISGTVGRILFEFISVNHQIFSVHLTLGSSKSNHNSLRNRVHSSPQFCWIFALSQQQQQHKQQQQTNKQQQISQTSVVVIRIDCRIFGFTRNLDYLSGFSGLFGLFKISVYTVRFALLIWIV